MDRIFSSLPDSAGARGGDARAPSAQGAQRGRAARDGAIWRRAWESVLETGGADKTARARAGAERDAQAPSHAPSHAHLRHKIGQRPDAVVDDDTRLLQKSPEAPLMVNVSGARLASEQAKTATAQSALRGDVEALHAAVRHDGSALARSAHVVQVDEFAESVPRLGPENRGAQQRPAAAVQVRVASGRLSAAQAESRTDERRRNGPVVRSDRVVRPERVAKLVRPARSNRAAHALAFTADGPEDAGDVAAAPAVSAGVTTSHTLPASVIRGAATAMSSTAEPSVGRRVSSSGQTVTARGSAAAAAGRTALDAGSAHSSPAIALTGHRLRPHVGAASTLAGATRANSEADPLAEQATTPEIAASTGRRRTRVHKAGTMRARPTSGLNSDARVSRAAAMRKPLRAIARGLGVHRRTEATSDQGNAANSAATVPAPVVTVSEGVFAAAMRSASAGGAGHGSHAAAAEGPSTAAGVAQMPASAGHSFVFAPRFAQDVAAAVTASVGAGASATALELTLVPASLGRVRVQLVTSSKGDLHVHLICDGAEARSLAAQGADQLAVALGGLAFASVSVDVSGHGARGEDDELRKTRSAQDYGGLAIAHAGAVRVDSGPLYPEGFYARA